MKNSNQFSTFSRKQLINRINEETLWDVVIIGGGATGLGSAIDAASRGLKVALFEQSDFSKGTSSRSTKLVHGGVRYLAQGNIQLVYEALKERGLLLQNAPHLVHPLSFIIPSYKRWEKYYYGIGLKIYDLMAGKLRMGKTKFLNKKEVQEQLKNIKEENLTGGIRYSDGQFDDARLALNMAQTAVEQGATVLNYFKVVQLLKDEQKKINGVEVRDEENNKTYKIFSKSVVNATGVFVDKILKMNNADSKQMVKASQGIHLVLDRSFLDNDQALMIPATTDGRVLFAVPWNNYLLVGTTDTPVDKIELEPKALENEIHFILDNLTNYLVKPPQREDVLSVFAGLRPLVMPENKEMGTKEISRDHKLAIASTGLITITGGKWTTYRKMAEDVVNQVVKYIGKSSLPCITRNLKIHGYSTESSRSNKLSFYGSDFEQVMQFRKENNHLSEPIHEQFPFTLADVVWAVRNEFARTVEDVLSRRFRILFLDAEAACQAAPIVASTMAKELDKDHKWIEGQVNEFKSLAKNYSLHSKKLNTTSHCNA